MRSLFTILSCAFVLPLWANMAQPIVEGTQVASPFISQHVDILKETSGLGTATPEPGDMMENP